MAINTYVSQGDKWAQVTAAGANCSMSTWDPTQIDWTKYTTTPVDNVKWVGGTTLPYDITTTLPFTTAPYDMIGGCQNNSFINSDFTWTNFLPTQFTKPAGVRPDILMGFFGPYVHAMMFIADGQTYVVPFMERLGMIWLQYELNKWTAYDRKEFYAFIDNPDATVFTGTALNKREVQKTMSEAKDE